MKSRLTEHNCWENLSYTYKYGDDVPQEIPNKANSKGKVQVEFPDKTLSWLRYKSVPHAGSYDDMGHTYDYSSHKLVAIVSYHKLELTVPLSELVILDVKVDR